MDLKLFEDIRKHLTIVHHIPGRIRLKFGASIISNPYVKKNINKNNNTLEQIYSIVPGIKNTKVNILARSMVVEYDHAVIEPEVIKELFETNNAERIKTIINEYTVYKNKTEI